MEWVEPEYERQDVNVAARRLLESDDIVLDADEHDLYIVNNWRNSHNYPLNTFKVTLRRYAKKAYPQAIVAQRLKRLSSVLAKLRREPLMRLSQMQDIAGCRAIVGSVKSVRRLVDVYWESEIKHKRRQPDDYILHPRASGYRGVHLIYNYFSDKDDTWNDLKIELQFRSPLQHVWATAVETVGTFIGQALKSSIGEENWLRFFSLIGTHIAEREKTPPVPNTPASHSELTFELRHHVKELRVSQTLQSCRMGLDAVTNVDLKGAYYYLLALDTTVPKLDIIGYRKQQLETAFKDTQEAEKKGLDAVLVNVNSLRVLRRAYPNYYADTGRFLKTVREAIS